MATTNEHRAPSRSAEHAWPRVEDWGRLDYTHAYERQLALAAAVADGSVTDTIVTVEHPPTITLGRHASATDVIAPEADRTARGIVVVRSDRGGQATYHGPGQVVVYPIVDIARLGLGPRAWVCLLESALLEVLDGYGVAGERVEGRPGIWTGGNDERDIRDLRKIASIGLRVVRGVSYHGVSLNVELDVSGFACIVPCGSAGERITSLTAECGRAPTLKEASAALVDAITRRLRAEAAAKGIPPP